jgi:hypothetical protein
MGSADPRAESLKLMKHNFNEHFFESNFYVSKLYEMSELNPMILKNDQHKLSACSQQSINYELLTTSLLKIQSREQGKQGLTFVIAASTHPAFLSATITRFLHTWFFKNFATVMAANN